MNHRALVLALAMACLAAPVQAQNIQGMGILALDPVNDGNTVLTLTGVGMLVRKADIAKFEAEIETIEASAAMAMRANERQAQAVIAAARELGIPAEDVRTGRTTIFPVTSGDGADLDTVLAGGRSVQPQPAPTRYKARSIVTIKQRRMEEYATTLDRLMKSGASSVDGPTFHVDGIMELGEEARAMAIDDARKRAELYASAAGLKVVRIIMIDEGRGTGVSWLNDRLFSHAGAFESGALDGPEGDDEVGIGSNIGVMFELAPQ